ncbi:non-homologous end-joining DNA ligase [Flaviflexus huanghaiensis]|uniref:non-homologous end-joining DNA ligase n=1 Tax=Flaviflexus huanghaiensis TaxID=1111473 RepID=UPI0019D576D1
MSDLPAPMLATRGTPSQIARAIADGEEWAFEMKWDGYRMIAGVDTNSGVVLSSRNGKDLTHVFRDSGELAVLLQGEAQEHGGAIFDGELVALDDEGRPNFGLLQASLKNGDEAELRFMVFDILQLGPPGSPVRSLLRAPYRERRETLRASLADGDAVVVPPEYVGRLETAQRVSRELGLEGVIAKRLDSTYLPGQRGSAWVKLKLHIHQEVVVVGVRRAEDNPDRIRSLLLAVPNEDGELIYAGRIGSGFSQTQLADINEKLQRIQRKTPPIPDIPAADMADAWWVTPKNVAEVSIAGRTRGGRVRHAVWRGWRDDKDPSEVRWEV